MLKKENGVSLVALIITILVLLILAAVSLTLVYNVLTSATKDEEEKERNTYRTQLSQSINSIVQDVQDVDTVKTEENANPQEENTDTDKDKDEEAIANESEVIMQVIQGKYSGDVEEIKNIKSLTDRINDKVASSKITFKGGTSENDPLIIVVNGKSNNFEYKVDYNNYSVLDK